MGTKVGAKNKVPYRVGAFGLPGTVLSSLVYWLWNTVEDAEYPNKVGNQDRAAAGGEVFPGRANAFDGVDQAAYVADNGALDVNQASTDFVLSGWGKASASGNIEVLFGKILNTVVDGEYGFLKQASNVVNFVFATSTGEVLIATSIDGDSDIDWHLFTARIDITNSRVYVYVDSVLQNAGGTAFTGTFATLADISEFNLAVGNLAGGGNTYYADTQIRDVRIYHKDITSAANLTSLQKGEALGDEVAWWFCEGNSTTRVDNSGGNGYHLTATNFDVTSFVEGNWQSLFNKYGYNDDSGTYISPDMSDSPAVDDVDGTPLVFAGQAQYPAIARDRNCFIGDGVAEWQTESTITIDRTQTTVISFRVKQLATGINNYIIGGGNDFNQQIRLGSTGVLVIETDTGSDQAVGTLIDDDTEWHDYEITIVNSVVSMKQDGVSLTMSDSSITEDTTLNFVGSTGAANQFEGQIENVIISENSSVVVNWQFVEGQGNTVHDVSGNGNHLTGVNVANNNWGVIDTPTEDYLAEYGGNFVGKFNGVNDVIDLDSDIVIDSTANTTIFARVKFDASGTNTILGNSVTNGYSRLVTTGSNALFLETDTDGDSAVSVDASILMDTWQDVEIIINNSVVSMKVEGVFLDMTDSSIIDDVTFNRIAVRQSEYTAGKIAYVKIKNNTTGVYLYQWNITGIDSEDTFGTWSGTGIHTAIIPALSDKSADALGQALTYPQGGRNLIPHTYLSMPENIYELYAADQEERYEGGLMDAGKGTFNGGTVESWVTEGTNLMVNEDNALKITYVDDVNGAKVFLNNAADLNTDLIIGDTYNLIFKIKASGTLNIRIYNGTVYTTIPLTPSSEYGYYEGEIVPTSTTLCFITFSSMSAGEIIYLDNYEIFHKTTQTGNNLIDNGGARNAIGALITTDWVDTAGLGNGWTNIDASNTVTSIVTGNGFSGNAQRLEYTGPGEAAAKRLEYTLSKTIPSGSEINVSIKYRANTGLRVYAAFGNVVEEPAIIDVSSNTGDALKVIGSSIITVDANQIIIYLGDDNTHVTNDYFEADEVEMRIEIDGEFYEPEVLGGDPVIVGTNYLAENPWRYGVRYFNSTNWRDLMLFAADANLTYDNHLKVLKFVKEDE